MIASVAELLARLHDAHALRTAQAAPLVREVRARLPAAAAAVRSRFGASQVLVFGSFARGTPLSRSDVDIAVEGVSARDHFRAMALLSDALGRTVDLIRLEDLSSDDRARLVSEAEAA